MPCSAQGEPIAVTDFRQLSDKVWASPQITPAEVAEAARLGFTAVINNRPDEEVGAELGGDAIAQAARAAGLAYHAIPIVPGGFSQAQAQAMAAILQQQEQLNGRVLAYCRSGTRSTLLWALAQAMQGALPGDLAEAAQAAGYDLAPIAPVLSALAEQAGGSGQAG